MVTKHRFTIRIKKKDWKQTVALIGSVHVALVKVFKLYLCIHGQIILVNGVGFLIAQGCFVTYCLAEIGPLVPKRELAVPMVNYHHYLSCYI